MGHIVNCRGGEWTIARDCEAADRRFPFECSPGREGEARRMGWTGLAEGGPGAPSLAWRSPCWLPIAWLCCEADAQEGPKFAASIADAGPGDDAPASIACDWLEGLGIQGSLFRITRRGDPRRQGPEENPVGWIRDRLPTSRSAPFRSRSGPLHHWCRLLIASRCVGCGGRRDGEDILSIPKLFARDEELRRPRAAGRYAALGVGHRARRKDVASLAEPPGFRFEPSPACPRCGFPAYPEPPLLEIPEVAKAGA